MTMRFALFGTGFWARYQLAAWQEVTGARCVALYNRTPAKALALAREFALPESCVYDDPVRLLDREELDFVDIVTSVETHRPLVELCLNRGLPTICQKPMAPTLQEAESMLDCARRHDLPLFIHENWRWQTPIRALQKELRQGGIGVPWRAHVRYANSFPVFLNQPFLKDLEQFILCDMGTHILDVVRFLFGEVASLAAHTHKVQRGICGEDAATLLCRMRNGMSVVVDLSYASRLESERFPQTYITIEGEDASLELSFDYWIKTTTRTGVTGYRAPPPYYPWADARYDLVHASIVDCHRNLLAGLQGEPVVETTAEDNLQTLRLVFASYAAAARNTIIHLDEWDGTV